MVYIQTERILLSSFSPFFRPSAAAIRLGNLGSGKPQHLFPLDFLDCGLSIVFHFVLCCHKNVLGGNVGGIGNTSLVLFCASPPALWSLLIVSYGGSSPPRSLRRGRRMGLPSRRILFIFPGPENI